MKKTTPTPKSRAQLPRGIRNCNPLNIRVGNTWLGEVPHPTDRQFEQFVSMRYGLRAAFIILRRYIRRYHLDTVPDIIATWAPSSENNTAAYIDTVCSVSGIPHEAHIAYEDKPTMVKLVMAMAKVECGCLILQHDVEVGYDIA